MNIKDVRSLTQSLNILYVEDEQFLREKTAVLLSNFFQDVYEWVKQCGVDEFQGYYFSQPLQNIDQGI